MESNYGLPVSGQAPRSRRLRATIERMILRSWQKAWPRARRLHQPDVGREGCGFGQSVSPGALIYASLNNRIASKPDTMASKSDFAIENVVWLYKRSHQLEGPERVPVGVDSMDVICNACEHRWTARHFGPGSFAPSLTQLFIQCPNCGQKAAVENPKSST